MKGWYWIIPLEALEDAKMIWNDIRFLAIISFLCFTNKWKTFIKNERFVKKKLVKNNETATRIIWRLKQRKYINIKYEKKNWYIKKRTITLSYKKEKEDNNYI